MLPAPSAHRIGTLLLEPDDPLSRNGGAAILPAAFLAIFLTLILHAAPRSGSIGTPRTGLAGAVPTTQRQNGHEDPRMEFTQKLGAAAGAVALSFGAAAAAQDAVQWRVEDGGNGHWYARNHAALTWSEAQASAAMRGGGLATTTSATELEFIRANLIQDGLPCWLGGTIDCSAVGDACCEGCVWRWTTGEPFDVSWNGWTGDNAFTTERLVTNGVGFDDMCSPCSVQDYRPPSIIEWSADCNNDGIVDFGQIRAGLLPDVNVNGIPDGCEAGNGQYPAVRWSPDVGGNGHWYQPYLVGNGIGWSAARAIAEARGGNLASAEAISERAFIFAAFTPSSHPLAWTRQVAWVEPNFGPWIGGMQSPNSKEPLAGWKWITGAGFDPQELGCCDNSGCAGAEDRLHLLLVGSAVTWNDLPDTWTCGEMPRSLLIEWSADCNNDGIVDFGQILAGDLEDANGNNIPDCCEGAGSCNCPGDIARDGIVNGVDLAAVLNNWGTSGGALGADVNGDGTVDASDLSVVLGSWGPCP